MPKPRSKLFLRSIVAGYWPRAVLAVLVVVLMRWLGRRLPPADRKLAFSADAHQPAFTEEQMQRAKEEEAESIVDAALVEKVVLVSLVSVIFAHVLPDVRSSDLQLAVGVGVLVAINTALSHWLARRGTEWVSVIRQFAVMAVVNFGLVLIYSLLLPEFDGSINLGTSLFFVLLLTLLVTMFDRYRQVYLMRFGASA